MDYNHRALAANASADTGRNDHRGNGSHVYKYREGKSILHKGSENGGVITFHEIAMKCARELLVEIFTERKGDKEPAHKWLTVDIVATYYAQSMCFAAEEWISSGYAIPPREMAEAYNYIISRSLFDVMEEL